MMPDEARKGLIKYFSTHPPRCLMEFVIAPAHLEGVAFDGHGEELNTIFSVSCSCGHNRHFILGHYWRNPAYKNVLVFVSPLALRCEACGEITELIDTDVHGYDSELGNGSCTMRGKGRRDEFKCEECGVHPFNVYARFEYPDDLFTDDFQDFRGREQDLFTWFSLVGTCSNCSRLRAITDFECA